jgi:uncharacterized membrane protein affecting hemolysin expression
VSKLAKTLELQFVTDTGETTSISVESPKEPIDAATVKLAMEQIVASDAFYSAKGQLVSPKGIRVIERNVTPYELA